MKHLISLLAIAAMLSGCSSSSDTFDDPIAPPTPKPEAPNATKVLMGTSRSSEFFPMSTMVDDDDIIAALKKLHTRVGADESGAACN